MIASNATFCLSNSFVTSTTLPTYADILSIPKITPSFAAIPSKDKVRFLFASLNLLTSPLASAICCLCCLILAFNSFNLLIYLLSVTLRFSLALVRYSIARFSSAIVLELLDNLTADEKLTLWYFVSLSIILSNSLDTLLAEFAVRLNPRSLFVPTTSM